MNKALTQLITKQKTINITREERNINLNLLREKASKMGGGLATHWEEIRQKDEEMKQLEEFEEEKQKLLSEKQKIIVIKPALEAELGEYEEEIVSLEDQNKKLKCELELLNSKNSRLQAFNDGCESEYKALSKRGLVNSFRDEDFDAEKSERV